ncbi:MAG: ribbon-helix-helix protein, CopG family [Micrococcales bacterium]|nr:ribbon-helix-helix protein, CopG family [Micrococcales bacterium]
MLRTNIYLDQGQVEALDAVADRDGVSRAEVVRRLIDRGLSGPGRNTDELLNAIRGAAGCCQAFEVPGRGPGAREEHLDQMWAKQP